MSFYKRIFFMVLYWISFLSIRSNKVWVFGSYGAFNDNSKYLYLDSIYDKNIRKIWISKNNEERLIVNKMGYEAYNRYSIKGIYFCLIAKVYIYSAYVTEINFFTSGGAICINLWHGVPLKRIEFDVTEGIIAKRFNGSLKSKIFYPNIYRKHDYLLSPSQFVSDYSFKSAFRLKDENIIVDTYPRVINLINLQKNIEKKINLKLVIFYAPTWRDDDSNFLNKDNFDLNIIDQFLIKNDMNLYVKLHKNTCIKFDDLYHNIFFIDKNEDSNKYLIESNCLVTDYSSIYFDYLVLDKPIIFYRFDEEDYILKNRDFYSEIYSHKPGVVVRNLNDFLFALKDIKLGNDVREKERMELRKLLSLDLVGSESRLYSKIIEKLGM